MRSRHSTDETPLSHDDDRLDKETFAFDMMRLLESAEGRHFLATQRTQTLEALGSIVPHDSKQLAEHSTQRGKLMALADLLSDIRTYGGIDKKKNKR